MTGNVIEYKDGNEVLHKAIISKYHLYNAMLDISAYFVAISFSGEEVIVYKERPLGIGFYNILTKVLAENMEEYIMNNWSESW